MKKLLLSLFIAFAFYGFTFSQEGCNPGWINQGFIYPLPDSTPCIVSGYSFSCAFQINMVSQFHGILTLDSLIVDSIVGLPAGLTWFSYPPPPIVIDADSTVCISILGTTYVDSGLYQVTFVSHAVVTSQSAGTQTYSFAELEQIGDAPIPTYQLQVINYWDTCRPFLYYYIEGIGDVVSSSDWSVYPNPSSGIFEVGFNAGKSINGDLVITSLTGQQIYTQKINVYGGSQCMVDLSKFSSGIYMMQIRTENGVFSVPKRLLLCTDAGD